MRLVQRGELAVDQVARLQDLVAIGVPAERDVLRRDRVGEPGRADGVGAAGGDADEVGARVRADLDAALDLAGGDVAPEGPRRPSRDGVERDELQVRARLAGRVLARGEGLGAENLL